MCMACIMIDKAFEIPRPSELVRAVNELDLSDAHKVIIYDKALDKANELGLDTLDYTADLANEIMNDRLRRT